jgi:excisionase family DNA binding protein
VSNEKETEFLTQKEAAKYLGVHQNTLNKLSKGTGGPPVSRIGPRLLRYRRDLLLFWMREKEAA